MSPFDPFKVCSLVFNNLKVFTFNNFRVIIYSKRGCFVHAIYFYKDKQGNQSVLDYMRELARRDNKDSRIKINKLNDYIELLSQHGTRAGEPYIKHLVWRFGSWDFCGIGFYSWLGWMGALSYYITLSKRRKRHPDERSRKPSESCKIWRKEG